MLCTQTFDNSYRVTELATQPARQTDGRPTATVVTPRTILGAFLEGLAAHRRYEHLMSEGVHHNVAIRQAFGISLPASP